MVADGAIIVSKHVCVCVFRRQVEAARYYFVCGGENTVSDRSAGVKWDVGLWAAGVTSSGFSRVWGGNAVDVNGTVMHTHIHTLTENNRCTLHTTSSLSPQCVCLRWLSSLRLCYLPLPRKTPIPTQWPLTTDKKNWETNLYPHTCHPRSQPAVALPIQPSLVNSSVHHAVVLAAICTHSNLSQLTSAFFSVALTEARSILRSPPWSLYCHSSCLCHGFSRRTKNGHEHVCVCVHIANT